MLTVSGPVPDVIGDGGARWRLSLSAGDRVGFALQYSTRAESAPKTWTARQVRKRIGDTAQGWRSWAKLHQQYDGPARSLVHHSGRVLHTLTYQPTGAIIAAPTTSLGESSGGTRNWDYRYAWVRDTSFTLKALWIAACPDEAERFVRFLIETTGSAQESSQGIQIVYGIGGEHDLTERDLDHLAGWRKSQPVRLGNDAWKQRQHDVFGELLDAALQLHDEFTPSNDTCRFLVGLADAAMDAWPQPDCGIWEARSEPRHYVFSKLMCWVALDRGVNWPSWLGVPERAPQWRAEADEISATILERGWNQQVGAYTQCLDGDELDASALMLAITGFLPAHDRRMASTIERIASDLTAPNGLLYRYCNDDGLDGDEGTFLLCSYWLVECLAAPERVPEPSCCSSEPRRAPMISVS